MNIGSIIRIAVPDTSPPKIKWFVIVSKADDHFAIVYINTDPRYQPPTAELQGLQLPISVSDCPMLDWDSHVDCSDVREKKVKAIEKRFKEEPECFRGILSPPQLRRVLDLIKKAKSITPATKKKYKLGF